jgi:hypothetical protein
MEVPETETQNRCEKFMKELIQENCPYQKEKNPHIETVLSTLKEKKIWFRTIVRKLK